MTSEGEGDGDTGATHFESIEKRVYDGYKTKMVGRLSASHPLGDLLFDAAITKVGEGGKGEHDETADDDHG